MTLPPSGRHRDQVPSPSPAETPPLLRVVSGSPTDEELAALTVVVAALAQQRPARRTTPVGGWASSADRHQQPLRSGPGGWRASGRFS
jgi:Acyl-CoA carboxylase epsilon subunit